MVMLYGWHVLTNRSEESITRRNLLWRIASTAGTMGESGKVDYHFLNCSFDFRCPPLPHGAISFKRSS